MLNKTGRFSRYDIGSDGLRQIEICDASAHNSSLITFTQAGLAEKCSESSQKAVVAITKLGRTDRMPRQARQQDDAANCKVDRSECAGGP